MIDVIGLVRTPIIVASDLQLLRSCFSTCDQNTLAMPFPTLCSTPHQHQQTLSWQLFLVVIRHHRLVHYQVPDIILTARIRFYHRHRHSLDCYHLIHRWLNISLRTLYTREWVHQIYILKIQMDVNNALDNPKNVKQIRRDWGLIIMLTNRVAGMKCT